MQSLVQASISRSLRHYDRHSEGCGSYDCERWEISFGLGKVEAILIRIKEQVRSGTQD